LKLVFKRLASDKSDRTRLGRNFCRFVVGGTAPALEAQPPSGSPSSAGVFTRSGGLWTQQGKKPRFETAPRSDAQPPMWRSCLRGTCEVLPAPGCTRPPLVARARDPEGADATPNGRPRFRFGHGAGPFSGFSRSKNDLDAKLGAALAPRTPHDFRRSLSTTLHERFGVPPPIVETILDHVGGHKAGVAGVYNKASYLDQRRPRTLGPTRHADHEQPGVRIAPVA
jgi:hypothetical protein